MMDLKTAAALDAAHYMPTFGARFPVLFEKGEGMHLYDQEGKEYLDFLAGIAVTSLGHHHPAVTEAISVQANRVLHLSNYFYSEPQATLAALLAEAAGGMKVFFGNSGAEANEAAVKLARRYFSARGENRYEVISMENSFHGRTLAMVAATGQKKYQDPYRPLPEGFVQAPYNDIAALRAAIGPHTCAVMLETIQGEGGVIVGEPAYLQQVRQLCDEAGILLILDEVQTGMGRTGELFSWQGLGIEPDIFTLAKALGNGVPIGAALAKPAVADAFHPGDHGTTFGGNPLACAAGVAVMRTMSRPGFLEHVREMGAYFQERLCQLATKYPHLLGQPRGRGLLLGLPLLGLEGKRVVADALECGFVLNCAGGNTLRFVPPLILERADVDRLMEFLAVMMESEGTK